MKKLLAILCLLSLVGLAAPAHAAGWTAALQEALNKGNYNQINIIAASNPTEQGAIALFLLQQAQSGNNLNGKIKTFTAATPFVGQIGAGDSGQANDLILAMLKVADDESFQDKDPKGAAAIFTAALIMSNQPNIVASNPNLHSGVLEAARKFRDRHPGADNSFDEQVSLAEAGGAPTVPPYGTINPRRVPNGTTTTETPPLVPSEE